MGKTGTRAQKLRMAEEFVLRNMLPLKPGEAMPSLRVLMAGSGLGRNLFEKALGRLIAEGKLEAREREGVFRTTLQNHAANGAIVDVIVCSELRHDEAPSFIGDLMRCLLRKGSELDFSMRAHYFDPARPLVELSNLAREKAVQNCFLLVPDSRHLAETLASAGVANLVSVAPRHRPVEGPAVVDAPDMVERQLEILFQNGHKKIGYIHGVEDYGGMAQLLRRESFYRIMAERGLRVRPEWVFPHTLDKAEFLRNLESLARPPRPTALISVDPALPALYTFFASRGVAVGRDISIVGTDGCDFNFLCPEPATIVNSREGMAETSWDLMARLIRGEPVTDVTFFPLSASEGRTVRNISKKQHKE